MWAQSKSKHEARAFVYSVGKGHRDEVPSIPSNHTQLSYCGKEKGEQKEVNEEGGNQLTPNSLSDYKVNMLMSFKW